MGKGEVKFVTLCIVTFIAFYIQILSFEDFEKCVKTWLETECLNLSDNKNRSEGNHTTAAAVNTSVIKQRPGKAKEETCSDDRPRRVCRTFAFHYFAVALSVELLLSAACLCACVAFCGVHTTLVDTLLRLCRHCSQYYSYKQLQKESKGIADSQLKAVTVIGSANCVFKIDPIEEKTLYEFVRALCEKSWKDTITGAGADAVGLCHSSITVKTILLIQNKDLAQSYEAEYQNSNRRFTLPFILRERPIRTSLYVYEPGTPKQPIRNPEKRATKQVLRSSDQKCRKSKKHERKASCCDQIIELTPFLPLPVVDANDTKQPLNAPSSGDLKQSLGPTPTRNLKQSVQVPSTGDLKQSLSSPPTGNQKQCIKVPSTGDLKQSLSVPPTTDLLESPGEDAEKTLEAITAVTQKGMLVSSAEDMKYAHAPSSNGASFRYGCCREGELFLLHGTRRDNLKGIIENGFDIGKCERGLYGRGIYLAESSQKADQYADEKNGRRTDNLSMLVVRTSLGTVGMYSDKQTESSYDTVVGGQGKRFREFVKTNTTQMYPEFLVIYDRT